jgi:hypothetical protein
MEAACSSETSVDFQGATRRLEANLISYFLKLPIVSNDNIAEAHGCEVEATLVVATVCSLAVVTYPNTQTQFG